MNPSHFKHPQNIKNELKQLSIKTVEKHLQKIGYPQNIKEQVLSFLIESKVISIAKMQ